MPHVPRLSDLAPAIRDACGPYPVTLAYLFGSQARGTADDESDIDIAVLADPGLSDAERSALRLRLLCDCAAALGVALERIDLIVLQDVPVLLQYNAVRRGRLLFVRDASARRAYELAVERRYEDGRQAVGEETALTLRRILSRSA